MTDTPKKRRWYQLLGDGYKIAKKTYPALPWILLGTFVAVLALFIIIGLVLHSKILWTISGIIIAPMITMIVLTRLIERASYKQMEGIPGAAGAIISRIKRGWSYSEEPVRFNARTQDLVYRLIGKPGIVLVTEGPSHRVAKLVGEERKLAKRIAPNVPVHVVESGTEEGQVPLAKLMKALRKFPKKLTGPEVSVVAKRFDTVNTNKLPIPKGIDPQRMRPNRKAMRGR